jgi:outer membrane protein
MVNVEAAADVVVMPCEVATDADDPTGRRSRGVVEIRGVRIAWTVVTRRRESEETEVTTVDETDPRDGSHLTTVVRKEHGATARATYYAPSLHPERDRLHIVMPADDAPPPEGATVQHDATSLGNGQDADVTATTYADGTVYTKILRERGGGKEVERRMRVFTNDGATFTKIETTNATGAKSTRTLYEPPSGSKDAGPPYMIGRALEFGQCMPRDVPVVERPPEPAPQPPHRTWAFGAVAGVSLPGGTWADANKLGDDISWTIPLGITAGYWVSGRIYLGAYGLFAPGSVASTACGGAPTCNAFDVRFGIDGHYHISPWRTVDPWIDLGTGYEVAKVSVSGPYVSSAANAGGFEIMHFGLGIDIRASRHIELGPLLQAGFAQFNAFGTTFQGTDSSPSRQGHLHEWFTLAVYGRYDL